MKPFVSVLIVEPSDIIIEGLRSILTSAGGFNVLAPLHDVSRLVDRIVASSPDVLIINPTLINGTPRQFMASIAQQRPAMPSIALIYQYVETSVRETFEFEIDIRMTPSGIVTSINNAISAMSESEELSEQSEVGDNYELSDRETDVLILVAKGLSSKEIADSLNISIHTVNTHRKNITRKTGIKSVAGLAVYAMLHNLM